MTMALITPTSDRPVSFALMEKWLARQKIAPAYRHFVIDDGAVPAPCTMGQTHCRQKGSASRVYSFKRNLTLGLATSLESGAKCFVVVEDDDWLSDDWLATCWKNIVADDRDLYGETQSRYYHVPQRRYHTFNPNGRSCLGATAMSAKAADWLLRRLRADAGESIMVDDWLWNRSPLSQRLEEQSIRHVGLKGMPGKRGLGIGHSMGERHKHDPFGTVLQSWVGNDDADAIFDAIKESVA